MTIDPSSLINGYLDETLSAEAQTTLADWINESPEHAHQFALALMLHDRLRGEHLAQAVLIAEKSIAPLNANSSPAHQTVRRRTAILGVIAVAVMVMFVLWKGVGETPASAAVVELNRLITVNAEPTDRTYRITVEDTALASKREETQDRGRPPKPPLDGAVLHVRGGSQFVLIRTTTDGLPFITGANGRSSWAVRPDGPVRVSADMTRFNRDLPGHEQSMPLINIEEGLERLRAAYNVQLLPVETPDQEQSSAEVPRRLLVAVKKKGYRGPRRVEITYAVPSGQIQQLRFVDMPYGPERLTVRLTLVEERKLGPSFFDHASHHDPARVVEVEE